MNNIKYIFLLSLLSIFSSIYGQEQIKAYNLAGDTELQKKLYGTWVAVKYTEAFQAPGASKNVGRYMNKTIFLNSGLAVLFKDSCKYPGYKVLRQSTWQFLYDNYKEPHAIGIKDDTVVVIELCCKVEPKYANKDSPPFDSTIILTSKGYIIIYESGLFLYMKKTK